MGVYRFLFLLWRAAAPHAITCEGTKSLHTSQKRTSYVHQNGGVDQWLNHSPKRIQKLLQ